MFCYIALVISWKLNIFSNLIWIWRSAIQRMLTKMIPLTGWVHQEVKYYPQNISLNVNSEEATPGCWPSRQSFSIQCLCSFAHLNVLFLLASVRYGFATLPRRPASWSRLFTVDVETGVFWVLFNESASWGLVRRLFLKLDTLMYFSLCTGASHSSFYSG